MFIITWIINTRNWYIKNLLEINIIIIWVMAMVALGLSDINNNSQKNEERWRRL